MYRDDDEEEHKRDGIVCEGAKSLSAAKRLWSAQTHLLQGIACETDNAGWHNIGQVKLAEEQKPEWPAEPLPGKNQSQDRKNFQGKVRPTSAREAENAYGKIRDEEDHCDY